jgi:hypothetical protein
LVLPFLELDGSKVDLRTGILINALVALKQVSILGIETRSGRNFSRKIKLRDVITLIGKPNVYKEVYLAKT